MSRRKTRKGRAVRTVTTLVKMIRRGEWFIYRGKVTHPSWLGSMQFIFVCQELYRGVIARAIATETGKPYVSSRYGEVE